MAKKITIMFDGEIVKCVEFRYVGWTEADCDKCESHEMVRELNYFNTDAIIDMANDEQNKDVPFFQIAEVDIKTTDKWLISERKDKDGFSAFQRDCSNS